MTEEPLKKVNENSVESNRQKEISDIFWKTTDRKKHWLKSNEIGPNQFHNWGTLNRIAEKSTVLANLIKVGNTEGIDHKKVFEAVMKELGLSYKLYKLQPDKEHKDKKIMCYDIESVPRWCFSDHSTTQAEATAGASKKALEFFMLMAM